jgi:DNA-3-methyladenine glycosylase I
MAAGSSVPAMGKPCSRRPGKSKPSRRWSERVIAVRRCGWVTQDPIYIAYHDREWGVPVHDDRKLFEFLILEGAQAGLSWLTILKKRAGYRNAFAGFDVRRVARFTPKKIEKLLQDSGIIRNRLKVDAAVTNARAFLKIQEAFGSFDAYSWRFVDGRQKVNVFKNPADVPATSRASDAFSRDLKQRGFKFVGSTIMYAHMQAVGMVNDHLVSCFRYREVMEK